MSRYISLRLDIVAAETGCGWQMFHRSSGTNQSMIGTMPFPSDLSINNAKSEIDEMISIDDLSKIRACGARLYNKIFPEGIAREFENADSGDVLFMVPPEWADIPFEMCYTADYFLGNKFKVGTIINFQSSDQSEKKKDFTAGPPLIIADPMGDIPSAQEEGFALKELFKKSFKRVHLLSSADKTKICVAITESAVVHFSGHSYCTKDSRTTGWKIDENVLFDLTDMEYIGTRPTVPWFVFSNSCFAGECGDKGNLSGIAGAFLKGGIAQIIGPIAKVNDQEALSFAKLFYEHLFRKRPPAAALLEAKRIIDRNNPHFHSHLFYRLFGDPCFNAPISKDTIRDLHTTLKRRPFFRTLYMIIAGMALLFIFIIILTSKCDDNSIIYFPAAQHSYHQRKIGKDFNPQRSYRNGDGNDMTKQEIELKGGLRIKSIRSALGAFVS